MKLYIKNEIIGNNAKLAKMLVREYKAVFSTGMYILESITTIEELNELVRRMIGVLAQTGIYPLITPFKDALLINLRRMDIDSRKFIG